MTFNHRASRLIQAFMLALLIAVTPVTRAQIPVTDVGAIMQLIAQLQQLQQQLAVARDQLEEARELYESMSGGRGMEQLLSGIDRHYLPDDWQALMEAMEGISSTYAALSAEVRAAVQAHAILSEDALAEFAPGDRAELEAARNTVAVLEALSKQALSTTSERFDALQTFADAIGSAEDQKAILDLQARIAVEQNMLANETNKLEVLSQASTARSLANAQRAKERRIEGIGRIRRLEPMGLE